MRIAAVAGFLGLVSVALCATPHYTELESLNPSQKAALEKLKNSVSSSLPHDYMKEDIYLVKFLPVTGFSVRKAEETLKDMIKWRKQNKVDNWEDPTYFTDIEKKGEYPIFSDGIDREGRPVTEAFFGDWNVRAAAVAGKVKQLTHYALSRLIDRGAQSLRKYQAEGKNVTQITIVINMDGFSVIKQACPTCLPLFLGFTAQYEKYWPNSIYRMIMVNTPDSFESIMTLVRPIMSAQTRAALRFFGTNKAEWKPYLDDLIDPAEISDWYDSKGKDRRV